MARAALRHIAFTLSIPALLMGCVEGGGSAGSDGAKAGLLASPAASRGATREVEAPDVFQTTDSALWDGRPSLGGIWVASPNTVDPERVVMFNPATGKSVTGALFRRERDNPGPTLQISSDAAEALGILAGQPTQIRVTALRKAEVAEPTPAAAPAPDATAAETAALATAALNAADAGSAPPAAPAVTAEGTTEAAPPAEAPKRKTWKERRAEAKAKREAEKAAKAAAAAAAAAGTTASSDTVDPAAGAVVAIETAPLDARSPEASAPAPQPEPKKTRRQIRAEQEAAAAAAAGAEAAATTPPPASGRPIQIASFSKEDNALRASEALAKIGITAQPHKSDRNGTPVWGVVAIGDAALLEKIKAAGFADAYFLQ